MSYKTKSEYHQSDLKSQLDLRKDFILTLKWLSVETEITSSDKELKSFGP